MSDFMEAMKNMIDDVYNVSVTENGAVGYRTTNKPLLDMNFKVSSYRKMSVEDITADFMAAFHTDKVLAMQWLFYVRDCREGLGERKLFREVLKHLAKVSPYTVLAVIPYVAEYGRYDDLWVLLEGVHPQVTAEVLHLVKVRLSEDISATLENKPISLLAKWLPSANASSNTTKRYAAIIRRSLGISEKKYRKTLSALRKYTNIVECKMSAKQWSDIDYEAVPSKANLIYNGAFLRNDEARRREYLSALDKGEVKINASTLFPHEIVHRYSDSNYWSSNYKHTTDATLEGLWKALPDTVKGEGGTIVVADGSGSMTTKVDRNSNVCALDVAHSLAIYFAERMSGQFKDKFITFSETPKFVDLSDGKTLLDKLHIAARHTEVANTNIEAVFDLILKTAVENGMSQSELPKNILIISDMEFDGCAVSGEVTKDYWGRPIHSTRPNTRLFKVIEEKFARAGYKMPRLVFWNVNSRTGTIPVKENDLGVALVSGFSPNVAKMVMSGKTDPYECLLETLNSPRYLPIKEVICGKAIVE